MVIIFTSGSVQLIIVLIDDLKLPIRSCLLTSFSVDVFQIIKYNYQVTLICRRDCSRLFCYKSLQCNSMLTITTKHFLVSIRASLLLVRKRKVINNQRWLPVENLFSSLQKTTKPSCLLPVSGN